ncbi:MAG: hypothetical protein ACFFDW_01260 [Candidatus Thorarchaeota archaeon]
MSEIKDTFNLKPEDLSQQERDWLEKFIKFSFRKYTKMKTIIFTIQNRKHLNYYLISPEFLKEYDEQTIPGKFLQEKIIIKGIPRLNRNDEYFIDICFIYWYFNYIDDYLGFKEILNIIFDTVFYSKYMEYDSNAKGYKVLPVHLGNQLIHWSVMRKTFLIGFGVYIGLFQIETVPSLEEIFLGLKNETLELIGLSKANMDDFGMVAHYGKLHRCWWCGAIINAPGDLCDKCYEYWDERTK